MSRINSWFSALSRKAKVATIVGVSLLGLTGMAAASPQQKQDVPAPTPKVEATAPAETQSKVEKKTVTETSTIPFGTINRDDSSLAKGTSKTIQAGVAGERVITYEVTYRNGQETGREKISEKVTKTAVDRVVANGTYVKVEPSCSNGTYVNSAGNTVCRPVESVTVPAGASAKCRDGTYSYSQSRRGTCSHHGGVAVWY